MIERVLRDVVLEERMFSASFLCTFEAFSSSSADGSSESFDDLESEEEEEEEKEDSDVTRLTVTVGRHCSQKSSRPSFFVPALLEREKNSCATLNDAPHAEHLKHCA